MNPKPTLMAELIAEFLGTFVLILFGIGVVAMVVLFPSTNPGETIQRELLPPPPWSIGTICRLSGKQIRNWGTPPESSRHFLPFLQFCRRDFWINSSAPLYWSSSSSRSPTNSIRPQDPI